MKITGVDVDKSKVGGIYYIEKIEYIVNQGSGRESRLPAIFGMAGPKTIAGGMFAEALTEPQLFYDLLIEQMTTCHVNVLMQNPNSEHCLNVAKLLCVNHMRLKNLLEVLLEFSKKALRETENGLTVKVAQNLFSLDIHGIFSSSNYLMMFPFVTLEKNFHQIPFLAPGVVMINDKPPTDISNKLVEIWGGADSVDK